MISAITVERTWQKMAQAQTDEVPRLLRELTNKQPFLHDYLMATSQVHFKKDIAELFFYLGIVIFQIMKQGKRRIRLISEEIMQAVEQTQDDVLELLQDDTDADFISATENILANYPEPEVLRYIVEALIEEDGDIDIPEDDKGLLFLELKKVLDALILSRDWYLQQKQT